MNEERNAEIVRRRQAGETLADIGNDYGLTRERVRQIAGRAGITPARANRPPRQKRPERPKRLPLHEEMAQYYEARGNHARAAVHREKSRKERARRQLVYAVRQGHITKPLACSDCGAPPRPRAPIQGHHPDYDKPLAVIWLCPACHTREHAKPPVERRTA